ncbi:MAG TPA: fumarylacetoacetate hydrolase family protein [Acetobacteraceae bacterium]|jgi:2-keto-4-pentenoate hydratase
MSFDPAAAAAALHAARLARRPAGPLPAEIAPRDEAEAAATQFALAGLMGAIPPGGFKLGATGLRMQAYLRLNGPTAGFMPGSGLHGSGAVLDWASLRGLGVECEIGVRLSRDMPAGPCDMAEATAAVGEMFAAIELVENRYGPPPAGDLAAIGTPTLIADQVYHAAAVTGAPGAWRGLDLATLLGRITVDGAVRGEGLGAELLGHPMQALAWLAGSAVAAAFGGLRAGQVVMLGSVTPPVWLAGPCAVEVTFQGFAPVRLRLR